MMTSQTDDNNDNNDDNNGSVSNTGCLLRQTALKMDQAIQEHFLHPKTAQAHRHSYENKNTEIQNLGKTIIQTTHLKIFQ